MKAKVITIGIKSSLMWIYMSSLTHWVWDPDFLASSLWDNILKWCIYGSAMKIPDTLQMSKEHQIWYLVQNSYQIFKVYLYYLRKKSFAPFFVLTAVDIIVIDVVCNITISFDCSNGYDNIDVKMDESLIKNSSLKLLGLTLPFKLYWDFYILLWLPLIKL